MMEKEDRYMSVTEVSKYLGLARNTVLKLINEQGMPAVKIGNKWKIKASDLDNWIAETNKK